MGGCHAKEKKVEGSRGRSGGGKGILGVLACIELSDELAAFFILRCSFVRFTASLPYFIVPHCCRPFLCPLPTQSPVATGWTVI